MRFFRKLKGTMSMTGSLTSRTRRPLEVHLWQLAQEHAERAQSASDPLEMQQTIGAVVMAAACLEAYINSVFIEELHRPEDDLWKSPEAKWEDAAKEIGQPFDKGRPPFQDLKRLMDLRNYVLHYKPRFTEPVKTREGRVPEARAKLTKAAARRAVDTCRVLITDLCSKRNESPPPWL